MNQIRPRSIIAAGRRHTVALKSDGTVIAVGDNSCGQCNVSGWRDIVSVAVGNVHKANNTGKAHTVGLKADGTVVTTRRKSEVRCAVDDWRNITMNVNTM